MERKHNAGKGDRYRTVDQKKWDKNWERAFGKKKKKIPPYMEPHMHQDEAKANN